MKKLLLIIPAALALAACQPKDGNRPSDARTFGLLGPVKEVYLTQTLVSTSGDAFDEDFAPGEENLEFTFDADGRVTLDSYGGVFEYDASGNFVAGFYDETEMERDQKGRLVSYDNTSRNWDEDYEDLDFEHFFCYHFSYDALNRVATEEISGWEWMETLTYSYDGDKVYPSGATFESDSEGWTEEGEIKFEYTRFDDRGNWTERTKTITSRGYDFDDEENAETFSSVQTQVRRIIYW